MNCSEAEGQQDDLRYGHSAAHVSGALAAAGFADIAIETASTRQDRGRGVPGLVVSAMRA